MLIFRQIFLQRPNLRIEAVHDVLPTRSLRNAYDGLQDFIFQADENWRTVITKGNEKLLKQPDASKMNKNIGTVTDSEEVST